MISHFHHYSFMKNSFHHSKKSGMIHLFTFSALLSSLSLCKSLFLNYSFYNLTMLSVVLSFPECHIIKTIQYIAVSDQLFSLRNMDMHWIFIHVFSWLDGSLLLLLNSIPLHRCTMFSFFIHLLKACCLLPVFDNFK